MTYLELAEKVLNEAQLPLSSSQIWNEGVNKGYNKLLNSRGKTPSATLGAQLYVSVNNPNSPFETIGKRPKKFALKSFTQNSAINEPPNNIKVAKFIDKHQSTTKNYLEKDLHPVLAYYTYAYLKCYTKTINHSKSTKKEFGEWVHPDMVGCHFPIEDWEKEVSELSSTIGNPAIKIFSFELKRKITLTNLRASFFQSVSNSSWANEGYLVTSEFADDEGLVNELKRLSTSFGIGVIKLDIKNPDDSEIIFPAKTKNVLDWETINKLTMNRDFTSFLKRINNDLKSREIRKEWYDKIINVEKLIAKFT